jgi:glucose/arabinose dehydrogenase
MPLYPSRRPRPLISLAWMTLALGPSLASAQVMTDPMLVVTPLTTPGLSQPTTMAFLAPGDFLVLEKDTGRVRRVIGGVMQGPDVLDVAVNDSSERGMLGIAIQQGTPIRVFLYYTEAAVDGGAPIANRVYRYDWNPAGTGSLVNAQLVLDLPVTPGPNHDGGIVALDAAGLLHAVIGDLNHNGQTQNNAGGNAPDDTGVILRVNSDGTPASGNPFTPYCSTTTTQTCTPGSCPGGETCITQVGRYLAYGVRNSFGMSFDPSTGLLWNTENGPGTNDEVNLVQPGFNSGWTDCMGPEVLDPGCTAGLWNLPGGASAYSDPEFTWVDTNAPTAILFPVGSTWGPAYANVALVADSNIGNIYSFPLNGTRTAFDAAQLPAALQDLVANNQTEANLVRIGQGFGSIVDMKVGPAPDNDVYVVSIFGTIFRIEGPVPVELQGFDVQ